MTAAAGAPDYIVAHRALALKRSAHTLYVMQPRRRAVPPHSLRIVTQLTTHTFARAAYLNNLFRECALTKCIHVSFLCKLALRQIVN